MAPSDPSATTPAAAQPAGSGQQCLTQHLLLLGCEAGGKLNVEEDEEVSLFGGVLRHWHPFTWHLLKILGTKRKEVREGSLAE